MLLYIEFSCAFAVRTTFPKTEDAFLQHAKRTNLWNSYSYGVFMFAWCMAPAKLFKLINLDSAKMAWPKKHHVISLVGGFKVYKLKAAKRAKKKAKQEQKAANDRTLGRSIFACSEEFDATCITWSPYLAIGSWLTCYAKQIRISNAFNLCPCGRVGILESNPEQKHIQMGSGSTNVWVVYWYVIWIGNRLSAVAAFKNL